MLKLRYFRNLKFDVFLKCQMSNIANEKTLFFFCYGLKRWALKKGRCCNKNDCNE